MSPICIFAYKRPDTTSRLIESLLQCPECSESELYVFLDGPKRIEDQEKVDETRALFSHLESHFKEVHLMPSSENKGLARSIISGVTQVINQHGNIIVLEDDLVVAPDFLTFMNQALTLYHDRDDIWSISGYTPNIQPNALQELNGVFIVPRAQCWGWATWAHQWNKVDWNVSDYHRMSSRAERQAFNQGGNDLYRALDMERHGKIESWAIRWAYAGYRNQAWTLNPMGSKVQNIGFTCSDSHQGWHDARHNVALSTQPALLDPNVQPNPIWTAAFKKHNDLSLISKIGYFMRRHDLGYHFVKKIFKK